jgi:hypothetical protein
MRLVGGMSGIRATGYDMTAALALGAAMGVVAVAIAEFLPLIEAAAIAAMNRGTDDG